MRAVATLCRELSADRRRDGELLDAFLRGPSEEAFVELIRRHGALVWGACRRLARHAAMPEAVPDPNATPDADLKPDLDAAPLADREPLRPPHVRHQAVIADQPVERRR